MGRSNPSRIRLNHLGIQGRSQGNFDYVHLTIQRTEAAHRLCVLAGRGEVGDLVGLSGRIEGGQNWRKANRKDAVMVTGLEKRTLDV